MLFLSLWYYSTWDWIPVSWPIGEHHTHYTMGWLYIYIYIYRERERERESCSVFSMDEKSFVSRVKPMKMRPQKSTLYVVTAFYFFHDDQPLPTELSLKIYWLLGDYEKGDSVYVSFWFRCNGFWWRDYRKDCFDDVWDYSLDDYFNNE